MKKKKSLFYIFIFSLLILGSTYLYFINDRRVKEEIIFNKIEQLEELATAKQIYREVIYSKKTNDILWMPLGNKEFLISLDYSVTAGIDITKGYAVAIKDGVRIITLPEGEILSIDALDSTIKEYFIKQRFSSINRDDYFTPINKTKEEILNGESIKNLLRQCEINAESILKSLLQVSGIEVKIEFSDSFSEENQ